MHTPSPPPIAHLIRSLAQEGERLQLSGPALPTQPTLVLPPPTDGDGFSVVTLLPQRTALPQPATHSRVTLHGQLHDVPITFQTTLRKLVARGDEWRFDLAWPTALDYPQRRVRPRIPVPVGHPAADAVVIGPEEVLLATVTDLHREGAGLQLRAADVMLAEAGSEYRCEIGRDDARIRLHLRIGHQRLHHRRLRLGGRIAPMTGADEVRLDHLVAELERLWLRSRRDTTPR